MQNNIIMVDLPEPLGVTANNLAVFIFKIKINQNNIFAKG